MIKKERYQIKGKIAYCKALVNTDNVNKSTLS